ncbi:hypothetical protein AB1283_14075 [Bacillus sp. S13(2024)]|uniref:hypothetical protein n=1 Tax=unclassified Bacillus (in: firmicutes) TaxID=185979 RepID=UPI003D1DAE9C
MEDAYREIFWRIVLAAICGCVGGIVNIVVNGNYIKSRMILSDQSGIENRYVFGTIKEPIAGIFSAILVTLPMDVTKEHYLFIQTALIAGFGSSTFLKSYVQKSMVIEAQKSSDIIKKYEGKLASLEINLEDEAKEKLKNLQMQVKTAVSPSEIRFYNKQIEGILKGATHFTS